MEISSITAILGSVFIGLGLSASSGFRVFLPLLVLSLAAKFNLMNVGEELSWVQSTPAIAALGVATLVEIVGFYIPWLDNLLDTIAIPAAATAGTIVMASTLIDIEPLWQWSLAIIAGGGTAVTVQAGTASTRLASTATTGGLANPIFATIETIIATLLSLLSVFIWPLAAVISILIIIVAVYLLRRARNLFKKNAV